MPTSALDTAWGWTVAATFIDDDVSASKPRGPGRAWAQMLAAADELDVVIGVDLDRVVRSTRDLNTLIDHGVALLDRDGHVCQSCFTAGGEELADAPGRRATLTIGHIVPTARGGTDDDSNLRAECQRCNDEARDNTDNPLGADKVLTQASRGSRKDKRQLYLWMRQNQRSISYQEKLFIKWRRFPAYERERVMNALAAQVIADED